MKWGFRGGSKVALVEGRHVIAHAPKRLNGYGVVGRFYELNKPYWRAYGLPTARAIQAVAFHPVGRCGPADEQKGTLGHTQAQRTFPEKLRMAWGFPLRATLSFHSPMGVQLAIFRKRKNFALTKRPLG